MVVACDREFARWAAALGARRVLHAIGNRPRDDRFREEVDFVLVSQDNPVLARSAALRYGVDYLAITQDLLHWYPGLTLAHIDARPHLKRVFFSGDPQGEFLALYHLEGAVPRW
jgi:hypothetical protein